MNNDQIIKVHVHDNSNAPDQTCSGEFELKRDKIITMHMHHGDCELCPEGHCHHGSIGLVLAPSGEVFVTFERTPLPTRVTCDDYRPESAPVHNLRLLKSNGG